MKGPPSVRQGARVELVAAGAADALAVVAGRWLQAQASAPPSRPTQARTVG